MGSDPHHNAKSIPFSIKTLQSLNAVQKSKDSGCLLTVAHRKIQMKWQIAHSQYIMAQDRHYHYKTGQGEPSEETLDQSKNEIQ